MPTTEQAKRTVVWSLVAVVGIGQVRALIDKDPETDLSLRPVLGALVAGAMLAVAAGPAPGIATNLALIAAIAASTDNVATIAKVLALPDRAKSLQLLEAGTDYTPGTRPADAGAAAGQNSQLGGSSTPAPAAAGRIVQVAGISGGVDASIAGNVRAMQAAAAAAGLRLTGGGWRSHATQVQLYHDKPQLAAKPGTSMHEKGLAIDFENCSNRSTPVYKWLAANASRYGFQNLDSSTKDEPWHWSTNGH